MTLIKTTGTLTALLAAAALTFLVAGGAAQAQNSCLAWKSTCYGRCASTGKGAGCKANCDNKYSSCRQNGCFTEGAAFGGKAHCGLGKR